MGRGGSQIWGLPLSLCLLGPHRVETFTSENNELWKKVETLENANRWVVPPAFPSGPLPSAASGWLWHSSGRQEGGQATELRVMQIPDTGSLWPGTLSFPSSFIHSEL